MGPLQLAEQSECVSDKPWSEVLNKSLKLFTFNIASEGGKSFGRVIFYIVLGIIFLGLATFIIDSITGWFSSWFNFWPFNGAGAQESVQDGKAGWWPWADKASTSAPIEAAKDARWYCKWNPVC